jgi:hypothetical protein
LDSLYLFISFKRDSLNLLTAAHAFNTLLRRQRSGGSWFKAILGKEFTRPYSPKNSSQKRTSGVAQDAGPEFKLQLWSRGAVNLQVLHHEQEIGLVIH